ncbi:DUF3800 domain-containing protein [Amycolatopsis benzoatilytica]|uniref:DUF3800 domain-containing protein n=1 Tax=Amycolatopsis benzoatilytica TaxID=346045 RepID=UPI0003810B56|nr:DUF3800 domain-containing protein [Amycolatopsis benzoatilytica]
MRPPTIACDESGAEGVNLIGANTAVFAHAAVRLEPEEAAACVARLRELIGSPAREYKANHLLRAKHRDALEWLLTEPLADAASVLLVDKALFLAGKVVDLLVDLTPYPECLRRRPDERARTLHRDGPARHGARRWADFLRSFTGLLHTSNRRLPVTTPDEFFAQTDVLGDLTHARGPLTGLRDQLLADPALVPPLDPLMPALADTIAFWRPENVIHDEQPSLTPARLAHLLEPVPPLRFVDSRSEPRVQVADFLAGVARRLTEQTLHGEGDPELVKLLRPYVLPASIWIGEPAD